MPTGLLRLGRRRRTGAAASAALGARRGGQTHSTHAPHTCPRNSVDRRTGRVGRRRASTRPGARRCGVRGAAPAHSKGAMVPVTNAEASDAMRALTWKATISRLPSAATMALHLTARATPRSRYFGKRLLRRRKAMRSAHSTMAVTKAEPARRRARRPSAHTSGVRSGWPGLTPHRAHRRPALRPARPTSGCAERVLVTGGLWRVKPSEWRRLGAGAKVVFSAPIATAPAHARTEHHHVDEAWRERAQRALEVLRDKPAARRAVRRAGQVPRPARPASNSARHGAHEGSQKLSMNLSGDAAANSQAPKACMMMAQSAPYRHMPSVYSVYNCAVTVAHWPSLCPAACRRAPDARCGVLHEATPSGCTRPPLCTGRRGGALR
jgi:hypothetical protein